MDIYSFINVIKRSSYPDVVAICNTNKQSAKFCSLEPIRSLIQAKKKTYEERAANSEAGIKIIQNQPSILREKDVRVILDHSELLTLLERVQTPGPAYITKIVGLVNPDTYELYNTPMISIDGGTDRVYLNKVSRPLWKQIISAIVENNGYLVYNYSDGFPRQFWLIYTSRLLPYRT